MVTNKIIKSYECRIFEFNVGKDVIATSIVISSINCIYDVFCWSYKLRSWLKIGNISQNHESHFGLLDTMTSKNGSVKFKFQSSLNNPALDILSASLSVSIYYYIIAKHLKTRKLTATFTLESPVDLKKIFNKKSKAKFIQIFKREYMKACTYRNLNCKFSQCKKCAYKLKVK